MSRLGIGVLVLGSNAVFPILSPNAHTLENSKLKATEGKGVLNTLSLCSYKVQGVCFWVVLHILLLVHESSEYDEFAPALYHCMQAGFRRPDHRAAIKHFPFDPPLLLGVFDVQHVHLHGLAVHTLVQGFANIEGLWRVVAQAAGNGG